MPNVATKLSLMFQLEVASNVVNPSGIKLEYESDKRGLPTVVIPSEADHTSLGSKYPTVNLLVNGTTDSNGLSDTKSSPTE